MSRNVYNSSLLYLLAGPLSESLTLMQYQRATVAQMIYRENQADQLPDVTLSPFKGKEGDIFYMDSAQRIQAKRATYSAPCGGILADLPGSGKSLICLGMALFLPKTL